MREQLALRFSYVNPEPLPPSSRGEDAGWTRPNWEALQRREGYLYLPRGLTQALRNVANGCGVVLRFVSQMTWDRTRPTVPVGELAVKPRGYQLDAMAEMLRGVQGIVVLPCGGGKSTVGAITLLHLNQSSLVLVGSTDLLEQWDATFIRASAGKVRPRLLGGGNQVDFRPLAPGDVAIATVQCLYDRDVQAFLDSVSVLLVDECQHVPTRQTNYILSRCAARWRLGLSATPDRADGWGFLLRVLLGPVLFSKTSRDLVELGFLQRPTIIPVDSPWKPGPAEHRWILTCPKCGRKAPYGWAKWQRGEAKCPGTVAVTGPRGGRHTERCLQVLPLDCEAREGDLDWTATSTALSQDPARQFLLAKLAAGAVNIAGRRVLMLVGRKAGMDDLERLVKGHGVEKVASVSSKTTNRDARIADLRTGKLDVLIATSLADEGLDVPELDCAVLGSGGKDGGKAKQRSGRTTRPEGKQAVVFDVVDSGHLLRAHWAKRRKAYVEEYGAGCLATQRPVSVDEALEILRSLG